MQNNESDQFLQEESESEQNSIIQIDSSVIQIHDLDNLKCIEFNYSVQQMLIFNKHYRKLLEDICLNAGKCKIILGSQSFKIYGNQESIIKKCFDKIKSDFLNKLNILEWQIRLPKQRYSLLNSASKLQYLKDNKSNLTIYKRKLKNTFLIDSLHRSKSELEEIKQKLIVNQPFIVSIKDSKQKHQAIPVVDQYLKRMAQQTEQSLKDKGVKIQISLCKNYVYVSSNQSRNTIQGKIKMKNIIKSIITLIIKSKQKVDSLQASLKKYLQQITKYPIIVKKINDITLAIVSKDNIIKQLLTKETFKKVVINRKLKLGFFFVKQKYVQTQRFEVIEPMCNNKGFSLNLKNEIYFIKQNAKQQQNNKNQIFYLMIELIEKLISLKEKEVFFQKNKKPTKTQSNEDKFYILGDYRSYKQLSQLCEKFGCDIRMRQIYLNKEYLKKYNNLDGEEMKDLLFTKIDWCDPQKIEIIEIKWQKMKGSYFYGRKKIVEETNQVIYFPEYIIDVI